MATILVAEDNDSNYLLLSCMLRKKYELARAINGIEAIEKYRELKPNLILMDIRMPEMDGLEATVSIRKEDTNIPIIALTAHAFDEDRKKAIEAGCNEFLTKPVNLKLLNEVLAKFIGE